MTQDSENSSFREKLIEHLFVAELLKISWRKDCLLGVAKPEVDNSGYDLILEVNNIVRHIQLKASFVGAKTARQKVNLKLLKKPSGCVIWVYFNKDSLDLGSFYYYGPKAGMPLTSLGEKIAKHVKGDKDGFKAERPNIRVLSRGEFTKIPTILEIYDELFDGA